jgi:uncharacterized RDD family membrane protein YckC
MILLNNSKCYFPFKYLCINMNEEYYLLEGEEKKGPYTYNQLINMDITIHTEIITPQSDVPQLASELPEFDDYFAAKGIYFPTVDNLASFGKRLAAFVVDYFGLYLLVSNIVIRYTGVALPTNYTVGAPLPPSMVTISLSLVAVFFVYKTILEATGLKGTLGKKIFNLIVVDVDGQRISILSSLVRNLGVILSIVIWVPFLSIFFSEHRQEWYDSLAKTYVITKN